jgi:hypothetical protein
MYDCRVLLFLFEVYSHHFLVSIHLGTAQQTPNEAALRLSAAYTCRFENDIQVLGSNPKVECYVEMCGVENCPTVRTALLPSS